MKKYRSAIKKAMIEVGSYKPQFENIINKLAQILEDMDSAREHFKKSGGDFVVEHTNKNGSTNMTKNPYYLVIEGLYSNILMYSRELGLTPAGLKKISDKELLGKQKQSKLERALELITNVKE